MAITTNINYPHDSLPVPLQEGYGLKPVSPLLRTSLTSGRARQRRRYMSTPTMASVTWTLTDVQAQVFEAWFRDAITDGSAWFNMNLRTPGGESSKVCRFTDIYQGPSIIGGNYWQYTAELELYDRAIGLPPPWGQFPDFISGMDIIDIALNREWPAA